MSQSEQPRARQPRAGHGASFRHPLTSRPPTHTALLSPSPSSLSLSLLTLHPTDGQRSGAAQEATSVFRSKKIDIAEAYQILGVNEKTPWEEVLKVRSCVRANNRIRAKMRHR